MDLRDFLAPNMRNRFTTGYPVQVRVHENPSAEFLPVVEAA